jgi:hypothetical protein
MITVALLVLAADAAPAPAPAAAPPPTSSFAQPESAYWEPKAKLWYVSSVAGSPSEKDGKGWITTIGADGKVVDARWIDGLNAPKGIRVHDGKLWVADIDELVVVDVATKAIVEKIKCEGAKLLNDVIVSDKGVAYVTDTFTDTIYEAQLKKPAKVFVKSDKLEGPNGILIDGPHLIVASFGTITDQAKWSTKGPGRIITVDLKSKKIAPLGTMKPLGNLDGLEKMKGGYLVTDYMAGKLWQVSNAGEAFEVASGYKASADIGFDPEAKRVGIPEMGADKVKFL